MTIQLMQGDLLRQDDVDAIVNTVNCVGVMGKGIALQFKNKWPANFRAYEHACKAGDVNVGKMFVFDAGGLVKPHYIINFPTKDHWRGKSTLDYVRDGLVDLIAQIKKLNIRSIAMPPLGCGNGGLAWSQVLPLIEQAFADLPDVEVRLFEPSGSPAALDMQVSTVRPKMTAGRAAILKLLETYKVLDYGLSKIEVQKLAYFLQIAGQPLKLNFVKHQFGPYSDELRHALNKMEGHFIRGLGDGVAEPEIEPVDSALAEANEFIAQEENSALLHRIQRVEALIDGFQSPYGMELLATVHWVAVHESDVNDAETAFADVQRWSDRKRDLMQPNHVQVAWQRLKMLNWI